MPLSNNVPKKLVKIVLAVKDYWTFVCISDSIFI